MFRLFKLIGFAALFFCASFLGAKEVATAQESTSDAVATVEEAEDKTEEVAEEVTKDEKGKEEEEKEELELVEVTLANGTLRLTQPAIWEAPEKLRSRITEREFAIPCAEGDENKGRLTMTPATGSVGANVTRWFGQFAQPDGKKTKDVAKVIEKEVNEQKVIVVDISGTFSERMGGGPFAPGKTVKRESYRMLGGIVQTKDAGQYFFKIYGPKKTIDEAEEHYMAMIESIDTVEKRSE